MDPRMPGLVYLAASCHRDSTSLYTMPLLIPNHRYQDRALPNARFSLSLDDILFPSLFPPVAPAKGGPHDLPELSSQATCGS